MDRGARKQNPQKNITSTNRIAPTHATQNIASKPDRKQAESPETSTESWTWLNAMARAQKGKKENTGWLKEEVPNKIKARASAWRNKRNKNRKWRQYKDQSKR